MEVQTHGGKETRGHKKKSESLSIASVLCTLRHPPRELPSPSHHLDQPHHITT